jgi:protein-disulfide isomerase
MLKRLSLILILICCSFAIAQTAPKPTPAKASAKAAPAVKPATPFAIPPRAAGPKNAPVVVEVFSDFQCPGCRQYYLSTLRRVIDEYCLTGKIYLIHHDFPLPQHPYSKAAAR